MGERGFTLAELLISIAIMSMIIAGIFTLQQQGELAYMFGSARVDAQQNARVALNIMTTELRSARSLSAVGANCNASYSTSSFNVAANTISFTDDSGTAVVYALSGTSAPYTLERTYAGTTTDLIGGVDALDIWCYDANEALTSTAANVRTIRIRIRTRNEESVSATSVAAQYAVVESEVRLRNL